MKNPSFADISCANSVPGRAAVRSASSFQGILFGLGHAYYGGKLMLIIMVHGYLLGLLTSWRKSLRPAMLAHGLQNVLGGVVEFVSRS